MKIILKSIFLLLLLACNSNNYKVIDISKSQIILNKTEIDEYKKNYNKLNGKFYSDSLYQFYLIEKSGFKIELKANNIYNDKWFTETTYHLKIFNDSEIFFEKKIENYDVISLTNETKNCVVEVKDNYAYILYFNGKGEKKIKQNLNLIIFELNNKQIIYEGIILQQDYGITNLSVTLDSAFDNLLISYTDISKRNNKSLTYSVFNLKNLTFSIRPKSIFQFDKWEKRNPFFIIYNNRIFLLNTTGDEYGFFSYKGKPSMAISTIGFNNEPENYVSFYDNGVIYNMLIQDDYFYYKLVNGNQSKEIIKKIKLTELK